MVQENEEQEMLKKGEPKQESKSEKKVVKTTHSKTRSSKKRGKHCVIF
mgnify:FL=1